MKRIAYLGVVLGGFLLVGCGDDDDDVPPGADASTAADGPVEPDAAPPPDAPLPDAPLPDAMIMGIGVGALCPNGTECAPGLICLDETLNEALPPDGYCTQQCMDDAQCGDDSFCGPPLGPPGSPRFCWQKCLVDAATCAGAPARVCGQVLNGQLDLGQEACMPGDPTKGDGAACGGWIGSCNAGQICLRNDYSMPGGMCLTFGCTVGDDTTCAPVGDGTCIPAGGQNICVDPCAMGSDCREGEGYECAGLGGLPFTVCWYPHAAGTPCMMDSDCGLPPWTCLTGPEFPGGYCSSALGACDPMNEMSCPFDSPCYDPSGMPDNQYCIAPCTMTSECRVAAGYDCLPLTADPMGPKGCMIP